MWIRVLPRVDHSGKDAIIVLEQNKFSKKVTGNYDVMFCFRIAFEFFHNSHLIRWIMNELDSAKKARIEPLTLWL